MQSGSHVSVVEGADKLAIDEKYTEDVQKLLDLGKEKTFLTYDDINNELPESVISPDDIEDIFATLGAEGEGCQRRRVQRPTEPLAKHRPGAVEARLHRGHL